MKALNIFLDLEGTVIDEFKEFPTFLPSHTEDIRRFIAPFKMFEPRLFIFSFAIDTEDEEATFFRASRTLLTQIEMESVTAVVRVTAMLKASRQVNSCRSLDRHDFIMLIGKERAFHDWCHLNHPGEFSFLIDDVVPNRTTHDNAEGTVIQTLNVRDLFKTVRIPRKVPA